MSKLNRVLEELENYGFSYHHFDGYRKHIFKHLIGMAGCYVLINHTADKIYVGSSRNIARRLSHHKHALKSGIHGNPALNAAYAKCSEIEVLIFETMTHVGAVELEQLLVDTFHNTGVLFNSAILDVSKPALGNPDTSAKISLALKGRVMSEEALLSKRLLRATKPPKVYTDSERQAMSAATSKWMSTEVGRAAHLAGVSRLYRRVIVIGVEYKSITEAAKITGIPDSTIRSRCKNTDYPDYYYPD